MRSDDGLSGRNQPPHLSEWLTLTPNLLSGESQRAKKKEKGEVKTKGVKQMGKEEQNPDTLNGFLQLHCILLEYIYTGLYNTDRCCSSSASINSSFEQRPRPPVNPTLYPSPCP
jgi:hypothetical protein